MGWTKLTIKWGKKKILRIRKEQPKNMSSIELAKTAILRIRKE
jgi:hypothetical protein